MSYFLCINMWICLTYCARNDIFYNLSITGRNMEWINEIFQKSHVEREIEQIIQIFWKKNQLSFNKIVILADEVVPWWTKLLTGLNYKFNPSIMCGVILTPNILKDDKFLNFLFNHLCTIWQNKILVQNGFYFLTDYKTFIWVSLSSLIWV